MFKRIFVLVFFVLYFASCEKSTDPQSNYDPPGDHTIRKEGIMHKPGLNDPVLNCASCHGSNLRGSEEAPSCYECHGKEW